MKTLTTNQKLNQELSESFLNNMAVDGKSANTIKNYRIDIRNLLEYIGDKSLADVTFKDANAYRSYLLEEKGMKGNSVNRKISSAKAMFSYLEETGDIKENVFGNVKNVKVKAEDKHKPRILTKEEVNLLISTIENSSVYNREHSSEFIIKRDLLLVSLMLRVGLRVTETITLTREQIDFEKNTMTVGTKSGSRTVPFADVIRKLYFDYIKVKEEKFGITRDDEPILVTVNGNQLCETDTLARIVKYCDIAGINDPNNPSNRVTNHSLRHSFATLSVNNGSPISTVSKILGHASVDFTYRTYVGQDNAAQMEVCNNVF